MIKLWDIFWFRFPSWGFFLLLLVLFPVCAQACSAAFSQAFAEQSTVVVVVSFVAAEAQLSSSRQPGGSWAFTSQLPSLALTHCAIQSPDRIFTRLWAPHHCEGEFIWKAFRNFFFFFSASKSALFAFVPVFRILQVNWDRRTLNVARESSSSYSSSSSPCLFSCLISPNFP